MNLTDYIRVYDDVLSEDYCSRLIHTFERCTDQQLVRDNAIMSFTEINVVQNFWAIDLLYQAIQNYKRRYWAECNINEDMLDPEHSWEELRMKRYLPTNNDQFRRHVDVYTQETAKRFLVYFWYLNDVDEGGETEFYQLDQAVKVKPRRGRLIMFPPTWQYLHAGLAPISGPKYIVGGYLHYK